MGSGTGAQAVGLSMMLAVSQVSSSSGRLRFHRTESATFSAPVKAESELNMRKRPEAKPLKAENT